MAHAKMEQDELLGVRDQIALLIGEYVRLNRELTTAVTAAFIEWYAQTYSRSCSGHQGEVLDLMILNQLKDAGPVQRRSIIAAFRPARQAFFQGHKKPNIQYHSPPDKGKLAPSERYIPK